MAKVKFKVGDIVTIIKSNWVSGDQTIGDDFKINKLEGSKSFYGISLTTGKEWFIESNECILSNDMKFKVGEEVQVIAKTSNGVTQWIKVDSYAIVVKGNSNRGDFIIKGINSKNENEVITQIVNVGHVKKINNQKQNQNKMNITKTEMKSAVETVANQLATKLGRITTLELKNELRNVYPAIMWNQYKTGKVDGVSDLFHELVQDGKFISVGDNGTYQTYQPKGYVKPSVAKIVKAIVKANPAKPVRALGSKGKKAPVTKLKTVSSADAAILAKFDKGIKIARSKALDLMKNNKGRFFTVVFTKQDGTLRLLNGQYVKDQLVSPLGYVLVKEANKMKAKDKEPIRNVNLQTLKVLKVAGQVYNF